MFARKTRGSRRLDCTLYSVHAAPNGNANFDVETIRETIWYDATLLFNAQYNWWSVSSNVLRVAATRSCSFPFERWCALSFDQRQNYLFSFINFRKEHFKLQYSVTQVISSKVLTRRLHSFIMHKLMKTRVRSIERMSVWLSVRSWRCMTWYLLFPQHVTYPSTQFIKYFRLKGKVAMHKINVTLFTCHRPKINQRNS